MKKNIIAITASVLLLAILSLCLVACNADYYEKKLEKKGYTVEDVSNKTLREEFGFTSEDLEDIEWAELGYKYKFAQSETDLVLIIKFDNLDKAKEVENELLDAMDDEDYAVHRSGRVVIMGTQKAVEDAK